MEALVGGLVGGLAVLIGVEWGPAWWEAWSWRRRMRWQMARRWRP